MPTEKKYVRTIVGRSLQPRDRQRQTGGAIPPMVAMGLLSALPSVLPMVMPLVKNLAGNLGNLFQPQAGSGTRLAGGRKKKAHRRY